MCCPSLVNGGNEKCPPEEEKVQTRRRTWRKLHPLSELILAPITITSSILYYVVPSNFQPTLSMVFAGGLFGMVLIPVAMGIALLRWIETNWDWPAGASRFIWHVVVIPLLLAYLVLVLVLDKTHLSVVDANPMKPRNALEWASKRFFTSAFDYFPITVVPWDENAVLPPNRQYVFGVHPHGIHTLPVTLFSTEGSAFDKRFPGLVGHTLTGLVASVLFHLPLVKEFFILMGYTDASRRVANEVMGCGRSLFICVGGEEEALLTSMGEDTVVLSRRKGFVRLALTHGADLVPVFGVGLNDVYETFNFAGKWRRKIQKRFGIALPLFHGRCFSPLPYRKPIQVLIGEPIPTPQPKARGEAPDEDVVNEYHRKYVDALIDLHSRHVTDRKLRVV